MTDSSPEIKTYDDPYPAPPVTPYHPEHPDLPEHPDPPVQSDIPVPGSGQPGLPMTEATEQGRRDEVTAAAQAAGIEPDSDEPEPSPTTAEQAAASLRKSLDLTKLVEQTKAAARNSRLSRAYRIV